MRIVTFLISIQLISFSACKKDTLPGDVLTGSWKLVEIYDKPNFVNIQYPLGGNGDVIINFSGTGSFAGKTLKNTFQNGSYTIHNGTAITFGSFFDMTKVMEDQWGGAFITILSTCALSSSFPCSPSNFTIDDGLLSIRSTLRYDMKLRRVN